MSVDEKNQKKMEKLLEPKQFEKSWVVEKKRNTSVEQEELFLEEVVQKSFALAKTFLTR